MKKVTVGYIMSSGHSGSTLTDLLLGAHPEVEGFGEIKRLQSRLGGKAGGRCTCGEKLAECPVWSNVLARIGEQGLTVEDNSPKSARFLEFSETMFCELQRVTGAKALIESSKLMGHFKPIRQSSRVKPVLIHLVRDGRAVAWSAVKKQKNFATALDEWTAKQKAVAEYCRQELEPEEWMRIRYEDIVADPGAALAPVFERLEVTPDQDLSDWAERVKHNIGGNRMRKSADGTIKHDTEYLKAIPDADWDAIPEKTWNLLMGLGYSGENRESW